jgi:hypothetical protein
MPRRAGGGKLHGAKQAGMGNHPSRSGALVLSGASRRPSPPWAVAPMPARWAPMRPDAVARSPPERWLARRACSVFSLPMRLEVALAAGGLLRALARTLDPDAPCPWQRE